MLPIVLGFTSFQPTCTVYYKYFPLSMLSRLDLSNYHETPDGWEVENHWFAGLDTNEPIRSEFFKHDGDTAKSIAVLLSKESCNPTIEVYNKRWSSTTKDTVFQLAMSAEDTLYHYYEWEQKKVFLKGKYFYFYSRSELSPDEITFYKENKDSLDRAQGDYPEFSSEKFPD